MKICIRSLLFAALLPAAGAVCAQDAPPPAPQGSLTLDQFIARQSERIMAADTDGDGKVSKAEFAAQIKGGRGNPDRMFAFMDANRDGFIDKDEVRAFLTRRFERMDANHDGIVTPDERMAMRQQRRATGGDETSPKP